MPKISTLTLLKCETFVHNFYGINAHVCIEMANSLHTLSNNVSSGQSGEELPISGQIVEGKAQIISKIAGNVFYNPVQEFNRDLR